METLMAGGILMIPLGLCAILSLTFIIERIWVLGRISGEEAAQSVLEETERTLMGQGEKAAAQLCLDRGGALGFIFGSVIKRFGTLMLMRRGGL